MNSKTHITDGIAQDIDFSAVADGTPMLVDLSFLEEITHKNVRKKRDPRKFSELVEDVKKNGVTQGITVRPHPENPHRLQVLAGYGRWQASVEAGKSTIPAIIKQVDDKDAFAIMLNENLIRENLSLVDEAKAAQQFVDLYDGNYQQAAEHLGWPEKKVRQRLELMNCHDDVLEALNAQKIKLGHATVLCSFTHKTQLGTLAKVIEQGMSVEELKERASQASQRLDKAPFDKAECASCPNNTEKQAGLFQDSMSAGMCTSRPCYMGKLKVWADARKQELEESYNKVLLAVEKPVESRKTVSPEIVGQAQFNQGCSGCESCAAILEVNLPNVGVVIENQCIDLVCHSKQVKKWEQAQQIPVVNESSESQQDTAAVAPPSGAVNNAHAAPAPQNAAPAKEKVSVAQSTPKGVVVAHRAYLRQQGANLVASHAGFARAAAIYALMELAGDSSKACVAQLLGVTEPQLRGTMDQVIRFMAGFDDKSLAQSMLAVVRHLASSSVDNESYGKNYTALMIGMLADLEGHSSALTAWQPTKDNLAAYRKNRVIAICEESGFAQAFDDAQGEGAFKALAAGKKSDLEKTIVEFKGFDWSHFVPVELKEQLVKPLD